MPSCPTCGQPIRVEKESKTKYREAALRILRHMNQIVKKIGRRGWREVDTHLVLIEARLRSQVSEEDIIRVVEDRWRTWVKTDQERYFRPWTIFRESKFEQYLGELPVTKEKALPGGILGPYQTEEERTIPKPKEIEELKTLIAKIGKHVS